MKTHSSAIAHPHPTSDSCTPTSLVRNLEQIATSLAMHCVWVVTLQRAFWAGKEHLRRPEDRLCQSRQKTNARDHDKDRGELSPWSGQYDVAEPRRCCRGHCEV